MLIYFKNIDNKKIDFLRKGTRANMEIQAEDVANQFIEVYINNDN